MKKIHVDIFGNPIIDDMTWTEQLEEFYGETIDFLSEKDGDFE